MGTIVGRPASGQSIDPAATGSGTIALRSLVLPNDPLFPDQWHLLNTGQEVGNPDFQPLYGVAGQDINVVPVWNMVRDDGGIGYTGQGVTVAVIDSGVDIFHPDLAANISPTLRFNAINGTNNPLPNLLDPESGHGTSVAGLIGAVWNNLGDQLYDASGNPVLDASGNPVYQGGGVGVAPNVTLVPIKLIDAGLTDDSIVAGFSIRVG